MSKNKMVGVQMPQGLWQHIANVAELQTMITGNRVTVSELIRKAVINQFRWGQVEMYMSPINPIISESRVELRQLETRNKRCKRTEPAEQLA